MKMKMKMQIQQNKKHVIAIAYICIGLASIAYAASVKTPMKDACYNADTKPVVFPDYPAGSGKSYPTHDQADCCQTACSLAYPTDTDAQVACTEDS
jgi:hypothetical protein